MRNVDNYGLFVYTNIAILSNFNYCIHWVIYAEMSEWSIVQSWNGCVQRCTPGSNPGLCAK